MRQKLKIPLIAVCLCLAGTGVANAQWVVSDPGNLAQSIINSAKEMVETAGTKANTLNGFLETKKVFEQGKAYYDALKSVHDVVSDVLQDLKNVVNVTGMSLTDAERLAVIDNAYRSLMNYRNLVRYYTNKTISVSYLRARKKNDMDRVMALYGNSNEKYW